MRENRIRRKSKVSDGRSVRVGLVGPKPRLKSVGDGQRVNIPVPQWSDGGRSVVGQEEMDQVPSEWIQVGKR
jgi:hypothetical protein